MGVSLIYYMNKLRTYLVIGLVLVFLSYVMTIRPSIQSYWTIIGFYLLLFCVLSGVIHLIIQKTITRSSRSQSIKLTLVISSTVTFVLALHTLGQLSIVDFVAVTTVSGLLSWFLVRTSR